MKKLLSLIVVLNIALFAGALEAKNSKHPIQAGGGDVWFDSTFNYFDASEAGRMNDEVCRRSLSADQFKEGVCKDALESCSDTALLCFYKTCKEVTNEIGGLLFECTDEQVQGCQETALKETEKSRNSVCRDSWPTTVEGKSFLKPKKDEQENSQGWAPLAPDDEEATQPEPETPENQDEAEVPDEHFGKDNNLDSFDNNDTAAPAQADQDSGVISLSGSGKAGCSLQAASQAGSSAGLLQVFAWFGLPFLIQVIRRQH